MKKISLLILLLVPMIILIGCSKSKQEIVDKCLLHANQASPSDMAQKSMLFQGCMVEYSMLLMLIIVTKINKLICCPEFVMLSISK